MTVAWTARWVVGCRLDDFVYPAYRRGLRAFHNSLMGGPDKAVGRGGDDGPAGVEPDLLVCRFTPDSGIRGGWAELTAARRADHGRIRYGLRPLTARLAACQPPVAEPTGLDAEVGQLFDAAAVGLALVDDGGGIVRANAALGEILETNPAALAHRSFLDVTPPHERTSSIRAARAVLDGDAPRQRLVKQYITD